MPCDDTRLISARLDNDVFLMLETHAAAYDLTRSDAIRAAITAFLMSPAEVIAAASLARQLTRAVDALADASTDLRRLGGLYSYALKARRPVDAEESRARLRALRKIRRAARALLAR